MISDARGCFKEREGFGIRNDSNIIVDIIQGRRVGLKWETLMLGCELLRNWWRSVPLGFARKSIQDGSLAFRSPPGFADRMGLGPTKGLNFSRWC